MKKSAKKKLAIAGICITLFLGILICIPLLFKDKIVDAVIKTANNKLNAELHVGNFGVNILSNFPNITLTLEDVSISGTGDFVGDTLVKAKSADATLNIIGIFKGKYEVSKINLNNANVYAKILSDGRVNWDIMKTDSTQIEKDEISTEAGKESSFKLSLKKISIENCRIVYEDRMSNMKLVMANWNGEVSGDFTAENTEIKTKSTIGELSFTMDGIPYLSKIKGIANATLEADLNKVKFSFVESDIQLNEVKASIDGSVAMTSNDGIDFDLKLNAPATQFKDILSILPAMYTDDFKDIKTSGSASLDGYIKGLMEGENYPAFDFKLMVNDAMFQYPSLPRSVDNINIALAATNKGGSLDNTVIDFSKFTFTLGNNPFSVGMKIQTPISDPSLDIHAKGVIDLNMIKEVYPLEKGTELNGKIDANLNIATRMSVIEREQYENINASGSLKLSNMSYKSGDSHNILINQALLDFSPKYVNLSSFDVKIDQNDINASGKLENFIGYLLKGQTLKGQLNLKSNYFNTNDFLGDTNDTSDTTTNETSTSGSSENFVVPNNIDFILNADMKQVVYGKVNITNLVGSIVVKDGSINMQNVSANALGGTAKITGGYSTASDPKNPKITLNLDVNKASFAETFKSIESIQKFAPIFDKIMGSYSMNLNLNAIMGDNIMQMLGGLTANGNIQTSEIKVNDVEALNRLSTALKTDALKSFSAKDLNIPFTINNGKINAKPFSLNIGDGGKLNLEGSSGLDQTIDFKGSITLPKSVANKYISNIPITITGTFTEPKIGVDSKALIGSIANQASTSILGGSIEDKKEELSNKATEEKAKQIQRLRDESQAGYDRLVEEAQKQGDQLVKVAEPKGALAAIAAKKASEQLVKEAQKQGQRLKDAAETEIKKLEAQEITAIK